MYHTDRVVLFGSWNLVGKSVDGQPMPHLETDYAASVDHSAAGYSRFYPIGADVMMRVSADADIAKT